MNKNYRVTEFANKIGKSASTLRRWDKDGTLKARRSPRGQRYYTDEDVLRVLGVNPDHKEVVVYCRVSSPGQKDDLKSQVAAMETFCLGQGLAVNQWIEEIGGGMNFKRKKFNAIIKDIEYGKIKILVIAHKDRLVRFGFEFFEQFALDHGCQMIVANQTTLSPQQEMVEDLMSVIHTFSCRLYGLRNYKKKIQEVASGQEE